MQKIVVTAFFAVLLSGGAQAEQDPVVMQGGDVAVSYSDIERYIVEKMPPQAASSSALLSRQGIYRDMAEALYTVRVLAAEAEAQPDFDPEQAQWMAEMIYQRTVMEDYRRKYILHELKDVNWDKSAREAYNVQKSQYMTEETVSASHILIKTDEDIRGEKEAQSLANDLRERAINGESFDELARQYSEDPSAAGNAGNLGFFKRGQMVKPFDDVVFGMQEPGAISEVVKSPFGYHVIQYHARRPPEQIPFEKVKDQIVAELQSQWEAQVWQDKIIGIRSAKDIELNEDALLELRQQYSNNGAPQ